MTRRSGAGAGGSGDALAAARRWSVERWRGSATGFHGRDLPDPVRATVWWFEVDRPAVALGSTQRPEVIDADVAARARVEVVRRRSGGGAVWLAPGEVTWVDVLVPRGDRHWDDDVSRSATWLGEVWTEALAATGVDGAEVHRGPMVATDRSPTVCFAGLARGEVTLAGRKAVGIAQRRTREGARFQCAVLHRWDPARLVDLFALDDLERAELLADVADCATGVGPLEPAALVDALVAALHRADSADA